MGLCLVGKIAYFSAERRLFAKIASWLAPLRWSLQVTWGRPSGPMAGEVNLTLSHLPTPSPLPSLNRCTTPELDTVDRLYEAS